ncbi:hypothetical protein GCM10010531_31570 [Blastococcus jejuensis]|uniref:Zinc metalloprotease n=1 Tax=Blastococcus jejuensis TaxID=351224 RepID=A0ABP6PDL4_9ACTN
MTGSDDMRSDGAAGMGGDAMSGAGGDAMTPGARDAMGQGSGGGPGGDTPQGSPGRRCAAMDVHHRLMAESAEYREARAQIENATLSFLAADEAGRFPGVAYIPVVVHVVYNTDAQNISEAQITSQIDVLNRDFRATNPDVSIVPPAFAPLIADSRVEFFLASTDPSGNPTNGITRTKTSVASFGSDDKVKRASTGGHDAWPADKYLNLWVCQLGGGLLGYAQFPGGPAVTDGVVCTHSGFGTVGTAAAPFHLGRTATHEVGHYLNLFHIWGDDGSGCGGTDEVADTPNQGGPNTGVPTFPHVSCSNGPNGDLFYDYMDYSDDAVLVMFTRGQAARMEACLDGVRRSLIQSAPATRRRPSGSVVAWDANRLDAFVLGTDRALYHKWWNGSAWGPSVTGYEYMGGICQSPPEVATWGPNRLDAFVLGTDRAVYHKWWNGSAWGPSVTGYEYMGGVCMSQPKVATWGPNRLDVFVLGTNRAMFHKWWNGSAWGPSVTGWESLGGICQSPPTVVSWGPNRLDAFVIGTNGALFHKWWNGSAWGPSVTGWESLGGVCSSPPTVVAWGPNRLDVFVIGTDSALYHKWWNGSSWGPSVTGWEYMGGVCTSTPAAVSWGPNRLDVFVTGTDSALYHKWWNGSAWGPSVTGYEAMGGRIIGDPRVVAWGPNRLDVFVAGTNGALFHKWWNGSAWGPSLTGYESLGGVISSFREGDGTPAAMPPLPVQQVGEMTVSTAKV